jgi:hypothetical protein
MAFSAPTNLLLFKTPAFFHAKSIIFGVIYN